jgi:hypothetical protein
MKRRTLAIGISLLAGLGVGIGLCARSANVTGASPADAARNSMNQSGRLPTSPTIGELAQDRKDPHSAPDGPKLIRQVAAASTESRALPSPPLPSRVEPGPPLRIYEGAQGQDSQPLPMPPVPSKIMPGTVPEGTTVERNDQPEV